MVKKQPEKVQVNADSLEAIADHVAALSEIGKMIKNSRMKMHTICLLVKNMTGIKLEDVERVLNALPELEKRFLK